MRNTLPVLVAALASFPVTTRSADTFTPPSGWIAVSSPDEERLSCANYSRLDWTVTMRNGSVAIAPGRTHGDALPRALVGAPGLPRARGSLHVLPVEGGYLVGGYAGEFGGGLTWFSADGKKSTILHEDPVTALISVDKDTVLSFEGLNHLTIREGTARWLTRANGRWTTSRTARLEEEPSAVVAGGREAYVVGSESLTVVSFDGRVSRLQSLPLRGLYPRSTVRDDSGVLWIGARHYVLRLVPQGLARPFALTWLLPASCRTATRSGLACVCAE